jgi:hypothetical protein
MIGLDVELLQIQMQVCLLQNQDSTLQRVISYFRL